MKGRRLAVVGATGAVGRVMLQVLEQRSFPVSELRLMASSRSAGRVMDTAWGAVVVEDLAEADPSGIDVALFSAGGDRSRDHAPRFASAGATVIDNSSAFRMNRDVPLVVAGANDDAIAGHRGIVANPNCSTMVLMMAVAPLHRAAGLRHMTATTLQAVSGSGRAAVDELKHQNEVLAKDLDELAGGGWSDPGGAVYPRPIGWNVLPMAGSMAEEAYTDEEWKLVNETRKILSAPEVTVDPACVRVPVVVGHGVAASLFFDDELTPEEAVDLLAEAPGVAVWEDRVPTPLDAAGRDDVLVGRVRAALSRRGGISLWAVGDNLRKGAALNAVQLAELVITGR
ncbi:MAG: aspartate-semialdehyde dehydrogenase [Acidimicrobiia bacterium]